MRSLLKVPSGFGMKPTGQTEQLSLKMNWKTKTARTVLARVEKPLLKCLQIPYCTHTAIPSYNRSTDITWRCSKEHPIVRADCSSITDKPIDVPLNRVATPYLKQLSIPCTLEVIVSGSRFVISPWSPYFTMASLAQPKNRIL
jgi:hypothetical protein